MVQINNSQLSKELIDGAKIQISYEQIPTQLSEKVVAVMEVNPKLLRVLDWSLAFYKTTSGGATIGTTDANKDTYISAIQITLTRDVTCDNGADQMILNGSVNGKPFYLCTIPMLALTATTQIMTFSLPSPIKLDRGSNLTLGANNFTAGAMIRAGVLLGYQVIQG